MSFVGVATFDGFVVFIELPRDEIQQMLPPDLVLEAGGEVPPDRHPAIFVLGHQSKGSVRWGGFSVPFDVRYGEFAFAVPFVRFSRGRRLHTWVPRMISSYFPATWTGNEYYGLGKQMGFLASDGSLLQVTDERDRLLLHAVVEPADEWSPQPTGSLPLLDAARSAFSLPIVGRKESGVWISSLFDWNFDSARVRPVVSVVTVDLPLARGLAPASHACVAAHSFEVQGMRWGLSWPGRPRA